MQNIEAQEAIENDHNIVTARLEVLDILTSEDAGMDMIVDSIAAITEWAKEPAEYPRKQARKDVLLTMDIKDVVQRLFVEVLVAKSHMSIANASGILASSLNMEKSKEAIHLAGEIIAVIALSNTGNFFLDRQRKGDTYYLVPTFSLDEEMFNKLHTAMYLPPMLTKPAAVKRNNDTPYLTKESDSLVLKPRYNYHNECLSLDIINMQNAIALCIDSSFLDKVEEDPTFDLNSIKATNIPEKLYKKQLQMHRRNWLMHKNISMYNYELMEANGNKFYVTHKVDKRGRLYAQGHYINPIGTSFKKAVVSLHKQEPIEVPVGYFSGE